MSGDRKMKLKFIHRHIPVFLLVFLLALVVVGCQKTPDNVIPEKEMGSLLKDVFMADAMIAADYNKYSTNEKKQALYESVFKKHGVTQAEFDTSLVWYGRNLDVYMKVYDKVIDDLDAMSALVDSMPDISPYDTTLLWNAKEPIYFSSTQPRSLHSFRVEFDSVLPSYSKVELSMNVFGISDWMKRKPVVHLTLAGAKRSIMLTDTIRTDGINRFDLNVANLDSISSAYGYIRLVRDKDTYYKVTLDSVQILNLTRK